MGALGLGATGRTRPVSAVNGGGQHRGGLPLRPFRGVGTHWSITTSGTQKGCHKPGRDSLPIPKGGTGSVVPSQGTADRDRLDPGRCPGLSCGAPSGRLKNGEWLRRAGQGHAGRRGYLVRVATV